MKHLLSLLLVPALVAQIQPAQAALTPKAALERLFTTRPLQVNWFAPSFLSQVPLAQIDQILTSIKAELGDYQGVQPEGNTFLVIFQRGAVPSRIVLDDQGRIAGLLFKPPRSAAINPEQAIAQLKALPGETSLLIREGSNDRAAWNSDRPLSVGSAFKLAVLAALQQQIQSGKRSWQTVVPLQAGWKSLPSGFLQTWPEGSALTLQTLASLMISQSDNTATDGLISILGRPAIEAFSPRNRPFLTTREVFALKAAPNRGLLERYRVGNEADRRKVLEEISRVPLPDVGDLSIAPTVPEVEWFFTTGELCTLMTRVADLPLMGINPGVATPQDWNQIAFKGGSEPGVLNLTTWLKAKSGKTYCVSATWNNTEALDDARFTTLYSGILAGLKGQ